MTSIRTASALNVVALGLVAGLVAFITFQTMGPSDPVVADETAEPIVQGSQLDNVYGDPIAMP